MNKNKNGLLDENGNYKPVDNKYKQKYNKITEESIREHFKDMMYSVQKADKRELVIWCSTDENGRCRFLEEFDKAMKTEFQKIKVDEKES